MVQARELAQLTVGDFDAWRNTVGRVLGNLSKQMFSHMETTFDIQTDDELEVVNNLRDQYPQKVAEALRERLPVSMYEKFCSEMTAHIANHLTGEQIDALHAFYTANPWYRGYAQANPPEMAELTVLMSQICQDVMVELLPDDWKPEALEQN